MADRCEITSRGPYSLMQKLCITVFLVLLSGISAFSQSTPEKIRTCVSEQEYEIYGKIGIGNFENATLTELVTPYVIENLAGMSPETVADFSQKNSMTYRLRCINKSDGKEKSLKRYYRVASTVNFSRIGFNKEENEALVYFSWSNFGNTCQSEFILLRRLSDKWEIIDRVTTVIC